MMVTLARQPLQLPLLRIVGGGRWGGLVTCAPIANRRKLARVWQPARRVASCPTLQTTRFPPPQSETKICLQTQIYRDCNGLGCCDRSKGATMAITE